MNFKFICIALLSIICITVAAQDVNGKKNSRKFEDKNGKLITDPKIIEHYLQIAEQQKLIYAKQNVSKNTNQVPVQICSNGNFEEFQTLSNVNYLTNFQYIATQIQNPIQCVSANTNANLDIKQYNPADTGLMATTVPSNFIDEYIGNINAFDQYCTKLNYKNSGQTMTLLQAKRFKTDNENSLVFNYKVVLQSVDGNDHKDEQPFFKARVLNNSGIVVSEFCLIADTENCIFTVASTLEAGSKVLCTKNWQSGILDISSIPNNENFTVEFMTTRCGLGGHFGYSYIDDICVLNASENLQGSITLDPLYKTCPTLPLQVCGSFTIPNSGGIVATVKNITLKVFDATNTVVYSTTTTASLNLTTKRFCFDLLAANLPNILTGSYNVSATIEYNIAQTNCTGTSFKSATDDDANPGWDIWFLNCNPTCTTTVQTATLYQCDGDQNGKEIFNLSNLNAQVVGTQTGLTFAYFTTLADATANTNPIANFLAFDSYTATIYVRVSTSATCFKIIATKIVVKNPKANISGILNVCSGPTTLTASAGASYLWSTGAVTQTIQALSVGTYSVTVTDSFGCLANGSITILPNSVAPLPTITITQPTCFVTTGTINVTSAASEFSFDGGATWGTNSTLNNAAIGSYLVKIKTASGCLSFDNRIDIVSYLSSFPNYSKVDPTFCGDVGTITITDTAPFYSFDDGVTWVTSNVKTGCSSGTYNIRTKNNSGCISNYNTVNLKGDFLPDPTFTSIQPYCSNPGSITITTPGAVAYSFNGGTTWQPSATLSGLISGSYIIMIKNAQGCTSTTAYVYLVNLEYSYPTYKITDAGCNKYAKIEITTVADEYSFDNGATWSTNPIINNLSGGDSFQIVVKRNPNCISYTNWAYINTYFYPLPTPNNYSDTLCDNLNDKVEDVNLVVYETNLIANSNLYTFEYYTTRLGAENSDLAVKISNPLAHNMSNSNNIAFVRVISEYGCAKVVQLDFNFLDTPIIVMNDKFPVCVNKTVTVDAGPGYFSYLWSNGATTQKITTNLPGTYWVIVSEKHGSLICSSKKVFEIYASNFATITNVTAQDWSDSENVITVYQSGIGDYEYSIDGFNYQDSNQFSSLVSAEYTIYVRDKNKCGIVNKKIFLLMHPKFFTPNDDGYNDFWNIQFSETEPNLEIKIFDRAGKFIKKLNNLDKGWDGTLNGQPLPATDYWFVVLRQDGREYRGHFSLKR